MTDEFNKDGERPFKQGLGFTEHVATRPDPSVGFSEDFEFCKPFPFEHNTIFN
jgi:hypothetical protein